MPLILQGNQMAKMDFDKYGGKTDFLEHKTGAGASFIDKNGQDVDPYGDDEAKEKDTINMNAGEAFNKADYTKIEAMGTDYPTRSTAGQRSDNKGDHFSVEDVIPEGNDAAKDGTGKIINRK